MLSVDFIFIKLFSDFVLSSLEVTCAAYAAGVASVNSAVETRPVDLPFSFARSSTVFTFCLLLSTPMAPLYVLWPELKAVPPAAESVIFCFGSFEYVRFVPFKYESKAVGSFLWHANHFIITISCVK